MMNSNLICPNTPTPGSTQAGEGAAGVGGGEGRKGQEQGGGAWRRLLPLWAKDGHRHRLREGVTLPSPVAAGIFPVGWTE